MSKCRVFILIVALLLIIGTKNRCKSIIVNFFFKKNIYICHPTLYSLPKNFSIVLALAGDSTITRFLDIF